MTHSLKASLLAAVLATGGLVAAAQAQTTTTTPATPATPMTPVPGSMGTGTVTPGTATPGTNTMGTTTMGAPPATTTTRMSTSGTGTTTAPAAVTTTTAPSRTTAAPVPGANSFTAGEARRRIAAKGYGQVKDLKKDDQGIWRGTTMKNGKSMSVSLDYQGNVTAQ